MTSIKSYDLLSWIDIKKLDWHILSGNVNAIELLSKNLNKIDWHLLSENPNAIELLLQNPDNIDYELLSNNPNNDLIKEDLTKNKYP